MTALAFLGTGLMGAPMVRSLLDAGHAVTVWNRSRAKAEALAEAGATVAGTPSEAVAGMGVVVSMLSDGAASEAVQREAATALEAGAVWVEMASIRPAEARAHAARLAVAGIGYVDAPVSGGTKGAEAASLAIMAGGDPDHYAAVEPVLRAMGRPVRVGPVGAGELAKLANQAIVACTIGAVAEAMLLLERGGADPAAVRAALSGGFADSVILQQHGARMTVGDFAPGGPVRLQVKDLENVLEAAGAAGLTLPLVAALETRFRRLRDDLGGAELDHSALYLELREANGFSAGSSGGTPTAR